MSNTKNIENQKEDLSTLAERIAFQGFNIKLDYDIKSILQVEKILGLIHKDYIQTKNDDGFNGIALEFGAYIIKVIEKHFSKGVWKNDHPELGKDTFPYNWEGVEIFPYSWCLKRIIDGPQDDVWIKFLTLVVNKKNRAG
jgi:hypothetical protein